VLLISFNVNQVMNSLVLGVLLCLVLTQQVLLSSETSFAVAVQDWLEVQEASRCGSILGAGGSAIV
jgi:hypothetical protein